MFVPNSSPAKTVMEFIAYVKANPGKFIMGSPGTGSAPHLTAELFEQMAGDPDDAFALSRRGAGIHRSHTRPHRLLFRQRRIAAILLDRARCRALATTGVERSTAAPELPTIAEAGIAGYHVLSWQGVFVPAKTPPGIMQK